MVKQICYDFFKAMFIISFHKCFVCLEGISVTGVVYNFLCVYKIKVACVFRFSF